MHLLVSTKKSKKNAQKQKNQYTWGQFVGILFPTINFLGVGMHKANSKQIHDRFCKWFVAKDSGYTLAMFQFGLGKSASRIFDWDTLQSTGGASIDMKALKERLPDGAWTVALARAAELVVYLLLECKSYRDTGTLTQTMECHDMLRQWQKKPVVSFVLYHGKTAWRMDKDFVSAFVRGSELQEDELVLKLLQAIVANFFYILIDLQGTADEVLLVVPLIGIALYTLKHIHSMTKAKIALIIRHSYSLVYEHRKALMWGITCYVQAAYPQFDEEVFQNIGDKVYADMVANNPKLKEEEGMSKPLSFDFEDALAEREAEGLAKGKAEGIEQGIEQGEAEGRRKVALRMLKAKMSEADIQQLTKLTKHELELLKKEGHA